MHQNQLIEFAKACNLVSGVLLGSTAHIETMTSHLGLQGASKPNVEAQVHEIFSLNIFPYANLYISPDQIAGGNTGQAFSEIYQDWRFQSKEVNLTADHFGVAFAALEFQLLTAVEYWRHGAKANFETTLSCTSDFIKTMLMPAMMPFCSALVHQSNALAKQFGPILINLAGSLMLNNEPDNVVLPEAACFASIDSSLRDLVQFILTPVACGIWIAKSDIRMMAGALDLPCGFSTREDMLTNLFHAAGSYGQTAKLILAINEIFSLHQTIYQDWRSLCGNTIIDNILVRTENTQSLLQSLEHKARSGDTSS